MIVQVVILKSQMILCSKTRIILIRYLWTSHIEMIRIRECILPKSEINETKHVIQTTCNTNRTIHYKITVNLQSLTSLFLSKSIKSTRNSFRRKVEPSNSR